MGLLDFLFGSSTAKKSPNNHYVAKQDNSYSYSRSNNYRRESNYDRIDPDTVCDECYDNFVDYYDNYEGEHDDW